MRIIAIMPARNEDWCLGLTARALLRWVDELIVLDHASTDDTGRIVLEEIQPEFPERVTYIRENGAVWEEMRHRQRLLEEARMIGATHIVTVDADEVLTADLLPVIRTLVGNCPERYVMQLPWLNLKGSIDRVYIAGVWADGCVASTAFRDNPRFHWSSESRGGYDFHHRHPMGGAIPYQPLRTRNSGLMHLQFVNDRRLKAKQYLYQLTEKLRWPGRETDDEIRQRYAYSVHCTTSGHIEPAVDKVPEHWWRGYEDLAQHFRPTAEPWQYAECARILKENPGIERGLDAFGLEF